MAMSDQDLADLKKRCITTMGTGASIAHSSEYMLELIEEVSKHRDAACCLTGDDEPKAATKAAPMGLGLADLADEAKAKGEATKAEAKGRGKKGEKGD